jgi:hypothetical protein
VPPDSWKNDLKGKFDQKAIAAGTSPAGEERGFNPTLFNAKLRLIGPKQSG